MFSFLFSRSFNSFLSLYFVFLTFRCKIIFNTWLWILFFLLSRTCSFSFLFCLLFLLNFLWLLWFTLLWFFFCASDFVGRIFHFQFGWPHHFFFFDFHSWGFRFKEIFTILYNCHRLFLWLLHFDLHLILFAFCFWYSFNRCFD